MRVIFALFVFVAGGCANEAALPTLEARAAGDHGCPTDRIHVVRHDGDVYVVEVCGVARTYVDTGHRTHVWKEITP